MPLLASLAVMLCTGMVVVVWSVMGGFLTHLIGSGRALVGDAQIELPGAGFSHYEDLRKRLEAMPEVEATAPAVATQAMLVLPGGRKELVLVRGIEGESFAKVSGFDGALWWRPLETPIRKDAEWEDPRLARGLISGDMTAGGELLGLSGRSLSNGTSKVQANLYQKEGGRLEFRGTIAGEGLTGTWVQYRRAGTREKEAARGVWTARRATSAVGAGGADTAGADKVTGTWDGALTGAPDGLPAGAPLQLHLRLTESLNAKLYGRMLENGRSLSTRPADGGPPEGAAILGIEVTGYNYRHPEGFYEPRYGHGGYMPKGGSEIEPTFLSGGNRISLHVLPVDRSGNVMQSETRRIDLPIANEFQTGVYEIDRKTILVRLDVLQRALLMDRAELTEPPPPPGTTVKDEQGNTVFATPRVIGVEPARVTTIYVRSREDVSDVKRLAAFKERLSEVVARFEQDHPDAARGWMLSVSTWRDQNITFISAVEKELGLTVFLFAFISIVAVFLVLAIFWSMVAEKTKDVGILRAIGASRTGVAWVWVRYGLVIGVVGALGGGVLSWLIVTNINEIHDWMGRALGFQVWDPRVYYFSEIPAQFKWLDAGIVLLSGVLSSGIGAFVPALRAARMDPVRALRFE